jgi:hypothetical protein
MNEDVDIDDIAHGGTKNVTTTLALAFDIALPSVLALEVGPFLHEMAPPSVKAGLLCHKVACALSKASLQFFLEFTVWTGVHWFSSLSPYSTALTCAMSHSREGW